jgi:hypothetical protein
VYPSHSQNYEVLEEAASMAAPEGLRSEILVHTFNMDCFGILCMQLEMMG